MSNNLSPLSRGEIIQRYEKRFGHKIIKLALIKEYSNQRVFAVLEWCNNREYAVRRIYSHLRAYKGERQPITQGSGSYPLLFDKEKDLNEAIQCFNELVNSWRKN